MKTWKQRTFSPITFIYICAVLSVVVTACPRNVVSSDRGGAASSGAKPQTQTLSETSADAINRETEENIYSMQNENDFEINSNGTIIIYTGSDKSVVIPDKIGDVPVSAIGDNAFVFKDIESIILPDSIIEIERAAFSGNKLNSITIPDNVIYIGLQAFTGNPLTSITIGNNVELVGGTYTSFPNNFDKHYNDNEKKAGTYMYSNGLWSLR